VNKTVQLVNVERKEEGGSKSRDKKRQIETRSLSKKNQFCSKTCLQYSYLSAVTMNRNLFGLIFGIQYL
jgi:hypothetical protein